MKKLILILLFPLLNTILYAQYKKEAENIVNEGVAYHDKGDYEGAIAKYDKALGIDKDNLLALAEKAYSLLSLEKFDESIQCCIKGIETHKGDEILGNIYVTYGNALDGLKKTDQALAIYEEGIKLFPGYYQLYFNKGITLAGIKKTEEAIHCFQESIVLNPKHASSHNGIANLLMYKKKRIPALLAYSRFLVLEPNGKRAKANLGSLQNIMKGNVEATSKKSVTINISSDMLNDTAIDGKAKENSFTTTDLILAMDAAMDYDKKNKKKSEVAQFIRKFKTVCASLEETQKNNYGFYWSYYVPYFVAMNEKKFIETFAYIAFASSDDPDVSKWLNSHKSEIKTFYEWSNTFEWKKGEN